MKTTRRPGRDVIRGASPDAIRRAAGISAGTVAAVKRIMAELGLDAAVVPPKRPASGRRHVKAKSAARTVRRATPGSVAR